MDQTKEISGILNDLIRINNDRIAGYEKALSGLGTGNEDLHVLFMTMIDQSRKMRNDLGIEVQVLGRSMDCSTTDSGKVYRVWSDLKTFFSGPSRHTILKNCMHGEDAAQSAYDEALSHETLPVYLRNMLKEQQNALLSSREEIESMVKQP